MATALKWDDDGDGLIENSGKPDQTFDSWVREKEQKIVAKTVQKIVASFGVVWWSGGFLNKIVASVLIHGSCFDNCDPVQNRDSI